MNQKKWDINNIPDQEGRVAIVTGSSSGIGYETARVLANKKVESNERSHDKDIAKRLWEVSEELTGVKFPIF